MQTCSKYILNLLNILKLMKVPQHPTQCLIASEQIFYFLHSFVFLIEVKVLTLASVVKIIFSKREEQKTNANLTVEQTWCPMLRLCRKDKVLVLYFCKQLVLVPVPSLLNINAFLEVLIPWIQIKSETCMTKFKLGQKRNKILVPKTFKCFLMFLFLL